MLIKVKRYGAAQPAKAVYSYLGLLRSLLNTRYIRVILILCIVKMRRKKYTTFFFLFSLLQVSAP